MKDTRTSNKPETRRAEDDDEALPLEDTSEGSTEAVGASGSGGSRSAPGGKSRGDSVGVAPEGASSGGFETLLGDVVINSGLLTTEEMDQCREMIRSSTDRGEPKTLADVLVENEFLTSRQLQRFRSDFDAKRSSQRIPGYRIKRKLGSGAMATVFLADQLSLSREVAIKVLPKKFSTNAKFIERFYKEGKAAAQLNHPNIVAAYDVGQAGEHHYFVMEYVDGPTLYDQLMAKKRLDEAESIKVIRQVAQALQHAHDRGFIHRDIKPKNIMINSQGVVKLADLGLARALSDKDAATAEAGRAYGTPYYISPEQIRGEVKIDPRADIYGLGATFYHMVTGRVPFEGKNPSTVMHRHLKDPLMPPDHVNTKLSAATAQVIEMMMAKSASERYHNAKDLLEDLDLLVKGEPPHFARKKAIDFTEVATSIASETALTAPVIKDEPKQPSLWSNPVFTVILMLLAISFLINILLAVLMATR